jgi:hypothetical protein
MFVVFLQQDKNKRIIDVLWCKQLSFIASEHRKAYWCLYVNDE